MSYAFAPPCTDIHIRVSGLGYSNRLNQGYLKGYIHVYYHYVIQLLESVDSSQPIPISQYTHPNKLKSPVIQGFKQPAYKLVNHHKISR